MKEPERDDIDARAEEPAPEEWQNRQLCSDENCIGVIGPDGRCKECGRSPEPGAVPPVSVPESAPAAEDADPPPVSDASAEPAETDGEWENRRLCSDGNCIGVIGPDGRCRECGKPYAG